MSASQRVSRGFHRLGVLLAAVPLIIGAGFTSVGISDFVGAYQRNVHANCAHERIVANGAKGLFSADEMKAMGRNLFDQFDDLFEIPLTKIGCSRSENDTVILAEAIGAKPFDWSIDPFTLFPIGLGLAVSLLIYGLVRALGWIIGGFAAS
jgi:hypothetical protein